MKKILIFNEGNFYKYLISSILFISLIASSINSTRMNLFNNISLIVNVGIFKTTIPLVFIYILFFVTIIFLLNKKFINKNSITYLLIFYIIYNMTIIVVSFVNGQEFTQSMLVFPFYAIFALFFLQKNNFNIDISYLVNMITLFIYFAIALNIIAIFTGRRCSNLDLLTLSLFYLSFKIFEKEDFKSLLVIIFLIIVSDANRILFFATILLAILGCIHFIKKLSIVKAILILIVIILFLYSIFYFGLMKKLSPYSKFANPEYLTRESLINMSGRLDLWKKYIFQYKPNIYELFFGHGVGGGFYSRVEAKPISNLHNIFIDEFYKKGIIGLLLLLSIIIISLKSRAPTYLKICFVSFLIIGQFELVIYKGISGIFFWSITGMLNNYSRINVEYNMKDIKSH